MPLREVSARNLQGLCRSEEGGGELCNAVESTRDPRRIVRWFSARGIGLWLSIMSSLTFEGLPSLPGTITCGSRSKVALDKLASPPNPRESALSLSDPDLALLPNVALEVASDVIVLVVGEPLSCSRDSCWCLDTIAIISFKSSWSASSLLSESDSSRLHG